jgi:hypothetical protein
MWSDVWGGLGLAPSRTGESLRQTVPDSWNQRDLTGAIYVR